MSKEINFNSIEEFMLELNKKAKEDSEFKKLCLTSPREGVAKITKMEIPNSMQFSFNEIGEELFLKVAGEGGIFDDDLDKVVGGVGFFENSYNDKGEYSPGFRGCRKCSEYNPSKDFGETPRGFIDYKTGYYIEPPRPCPKCGNLMYDSKKD